MSIVVAASRALRRLRHVAVLGLLALTQACDSDGGTGPDETAPDAPASFSIGGQDRPLSDSQLQRLLESEKARIDRAKKASQSNYDSLKVVWQRFLDGGRRLPPSVLLRCDPLQYVAETKIIGPEGGDIDFGPHKLRIPARALRWRTVITAEAPTSLAVIADFSPHGTRFARPVELQLSYKHCSVSRSFVPLLGVYISDSGLILEYPRSNDRRSQQTVFVFPDHFSKYAVAY